MENLILGGALALTGVVIGRRIDLARGSRETAAKNASRRFDVEYDSLGTSATCRRRSWVPRPSISKHARLAPSPSRGSSVDEGAGKAVKLPVVQPVGNQEWKDQIDNAV
jgi:hypothetical protein